jgi:hypothetical protein
VNKAELREQVEAMTEEEAADALLVYAPDWPDKITPIGEMTSRRRAVELPTFEDGTPLPAGSGETATGETMPDVAAALRRSRRSH